MPSVAGAEQERILEQTRRALGGLFALLGVYYCALGATVLLDLGDVTRAWIVRSGDADFRLDYDLFVRLSATGAGLIVLLGWRTAVLGVATARGRVRSWSWLAVSAVPLHFVWWAYRVVGSGALGREGVAAERLSSGLQFGAVCLGYLLLWGMSRRPIRNSPANIALHRRPPRQEPRAAAGER